MKRVSLLSALLFALTVSALAAQTTGQINGTVVDSAGEALPGVTITVTSPVQIGGPKVTVTEADGSFSFPALTPGEYMLQANLEGFIPIDREGVQVRLDRTTEVHVTLVTPATETIEVTAEAPVVDPEQVSTAQTFTIDYLENAAVGSANRSYQDVLFQVGGVAAQAGAGDNPSVYGSTLGENAFLVDGIDTTDPVTSTFGTNFNFDAIQEISFQTGGFEAEYGRATGGVVNVVTKSGGNEFSGTVDVRYTDESFTENGEHFDKEAQKNKSLTPGATLGGPILQDRVWFFVADEYNDTETQEAFEPATEHFVGNYYLGKLTWQASPSWQVALKHSGDPADIDNAGIAVGTAADAATFQEQGGTITQADVSGVLTPNLLWEIKGAANRQELNAFPQHRDFNRSAHFDLGTGLQTNSSGNAQFSNRDRDELRTSLSYFTGDHEFKGGLERADMNFESRNFNPAGFFYYDYAAIIGPYILLVSDPNPPSTKSSGVLNTAYLQDSWRVNDRFTAKLGVRYDQVSFENNAGDEIADMDKLQPRVGLAWDVLGDATTVASVSWGRFMHPSATTLPSFARTDSSPTELFVSCSLVGATSRQQCENAFGTVISDPENTDPNGFFLNSVLSSSPNLIQDGLEATFAEELIVRLERQILPRTSVSLTYVDKETSNIFEDTCIGNAVSGLSPDADCSTFMMANLGDDILTRDYKGAILTFESRASDRLHLLASYTYSKSKGSVEYTQNAGADFDHFPEHFVNTYGYLSDDRRHRLKVNGFTRLPWDVIAGFSAFWSSAGAFDHVRPVTVFSDVDETSGYGLEFVDPRGSHRGNTNYQLDLELKKGFQLGSIRAQLIGSVFNVLDSERPAGRCERDLCTLEAGTPNEHQVGFLEPTSFQLPRSYEVGVRLEF